MNDQETPLDPVVRLTAKIATFLAALDDDERAVLEQVAGADDEVTGFTAATPTVDNFWKVMSTIMKSGSDTRQSIAQNIR